MGVVRRSIGVDAHLLKLFDAEVLETIGQSRADSGVVLVAAHALDLDALAVQEEALVLIELDGANAELGLVFVNVLTALGDTGDEGVQVGRFDIPEFGLSDLELG